eukprot:SAG31_NODE_9296_length_1303_cov_0.872093_2_plen_346_part_01
MACAGQVGTVVSIDPNDCTVQLRLRLQVAGPAAVARARQLGVAMLGTHGHRPFSAGDDDAASSRVWYPIEACCVPHAVAASKGTQGISANTASSFQNPLMQARRLPQLPDVDGNDYPFTEKHRRNADHTLQRDANGTAAAVLAHDKSERRSPTKEADDLRKYLLQKQEADVRAMVAAYGSSQRLAPVYSPDSSPSRVVESAVRSTQLLDESESFCGTGESPGVPDKSRHSSTTVDVTKQESEADAKLRKYLEKKAQLQHTDAGRTADHADDEVQSGAYSQPLKPPHDACVAPVSGDEEVIQSIIQGVVQSIISKIEHKALTAAAYARAAAEYAGGDRSVYNVDLED